MEKIRKFIKSTSYYVTEEDEKIMKWNRKQQKNQDKKKKRSRKNDSFIVLSGPEHYEGKFYGIVYKSCGHEFIVSSVELKYRMAKGCKTCNKLKKVCKN